MTGNVIVGQSGGPTAVINASLAGVIKMSKELGVPAIYGMRYGIEGFLEGNYVNLNEIFISDLDIELLKRTPASYLGSCRYKLPEASVDSGPYEQIFKMLTELNITAFFYIGGNDSMDTIKKLSDYAATIHSDIRFIGVPKTIDNDLDKTDHSPGFASAAKYIITSLKELIRDSLVYHVKQITIVEVMGRNAGWLTAAAALAKCEDCEGPDLIYLPEVPFDLDSFLDRIRELMKTKRAIIVAVSEGIRTADGSFVCDQEANANYVDPFGHKMSGGTAAFLAGICGKEFGCKTRFIELSTLQRCAGHLTSLTDINEAYQAGVAAVAAANEGETGKVVTFIRVSNRPYLCNTGLCDVHEIANIEKTVPLEWITKNGTDVSEELKAYIRPLIQGELSPYMVDGAPRHIKVN